jgi:hypothetical protein
MSEDNFVQKEIPAYLLAAGNHDIANGDETPLISGTIPMLAGAYVGAQAGLAVGGPLGAIAGTLVGAATGYDWRFTAASAISGVSQLVNSTAAIVNVLPGIDDMPEVMNAHDTMAAFDDDLAAYYEGHTDATDTAGFIAAAMIPGMGALKGYSKGAAMLDAANAGIIGRNMGEVTGLLSGTQKYLLAAAEAEAKASGAAFTYLNANVIGSIAAGAGEQFLQGAIFETAVQVFMNKSPLLKDQDSSDIAENILHAGLVTGGIGGALETAVLSSGMRKFLSGMDQKLRPYNWQEGTKAGTQFDAAYLTNVESMQQLATKIATEDAELGDLARQTQTRTLNSLSDKNRKLFSELPTKSDPQLAAGIHQYTEASVNSGKGILGASKITLGLKDFARISEATPAEKMLTKLQGRMAKGEVLSTEEQAFLDSTHVTSIKLWGANRGDITPMHELSYKSLWDLPKAGEIIEVIAKSNTVKAGTNNFKISIAKPYDIREVTQATIAEANAREVWALKTGPLPDNHIVSAYDPALLRKASKDLANFSESGVTQIRIKRPGSDVLEVVRTPAEILPILETSIQESAAHLLNRSLGATAGSAEKLTDDAIASALNVKREFMLSQKVAPDAADHYDNLHAIEAYAKEYATDMGQKTKLAFPAEDIIFHPMQGKLVYDTSKIADWEATALPIMTYIKQQQTLLGDTADRAVATVVGTYNDQLPAASSLDMKLATREGGSSGVITAADAAYGSQGSFFQRIGAVVNKLKTDRTNHVVAAWDPVAYKLLGDAEAAAELSTIQWKIRAYPDNYIISPTGQQLIHADTARYMQDVLKGIANPKAPTKIAADAPDVIPVASKKVYDILVTNRDLNSQRIAKYNNVRSVMGPGDTRSPDIVYFPPPDPKNYPHFALVTDPAITGTGHVTMIHAASPEKLEELIALVPEEFQAGIIRKPKAITKPENERWYDAIEMFRKQDVMSDSYFDAALYKRGSSAPTFLKTDAKQLVEELRNWHIYEEHKLVREAVSLKYFKEFQELKSLGEREVNTALSAFNAKSAAKYAEEKASNPYMAYIRTALDLPNTEKIPMRAFQDYLDTKVSKIWDAFASEFRNSKLPADLDKINSMIQAAGIKTVNIDAYNIGLINHTIPRGALSTFTRRANAILTSLILKPSALNAINNMVGSIVLTAPETMNVVEAIKRGDRAAVGSLIDVAHVVIPDTEHSFFSTTKLYSNALRMAHSGKYNQWALDRGLSVRHSQEISDMVDILAISGRESALDLEGRLTLMYDKGMRLGKWAEEHTGNSYAEEMTRLTSALIMKQLTDVAVKAGKLTETLAESYIQTFVNRTNGVYLASQRPMMFNGPVGQAVGLFQTYMVTLIQQSLRHVTEGSRKSLALMAAAQGTIYGMAALPGFQQINTNLVGGFAGNTDNKDIFSVVYNAMDKNKADWVMYGALSNSLGLLSPQLKLNMYTRGDVNPRNVTLIPLDPRDYPIASASAKFFGNLQEVFSKIYLQGADPTTSLMQGLEHNGISRELSGLAQVMEAFTNPSHKSYATSNSGDIVGSNDLLSLTNLVRLAGAKPLDEAIALDRSFRQAAWNAKQHDRTERLGEAIKTKLVGINQGDITQEDLLDFQREYIKIGGKQENFNRWAIDKWKRANNSKAEITMMKELKSGDSQQMQLLMGGRPPEGIMTEEGDSSNE